MSNSVPHHAHLPASVTTALASRTPPARAGGLWGAARGLIGNLWTFFRGLHPAAQALAVAGTAIAAARTVSGSKHEAAQRVA